MAGVNMARPPQIHRRRVWDRSVNGCAVGGVGLLIALVAMIFLFAQGLGSCDIDIGSDRADCFDSKRKLVAASADGTGAEVRAELRGGTDPDRADRDGNRPLACAAMVGNVEAVKALLFAGADPEMAGKNGGRPVVAAVSGEGNGRDSTVDDESDYEGFAGLGNPKRRQIVELLARAGANLDGAVSPAIEAKQIETLHLLLRLGADPDGDPDGISPLTLVAANTCGFPPSEGSCTDNPLSLTDLLLDAGADPDHGGTLGSFAAEFVVSSHVEHGRFEDLDDAPAFRDLTGKLPNSGEVTPLVAAIALEQPAIVERLLAAHADPNRPSYGKLTPLWTAVVVGNEHAIAELLEAGADPRPDDPHLASAIRAARLLHRKDLVDILQAAPRPGG